MNLNPNWVKKFILFYGIAGQRKGHLSSTKTSVSSFDVKDLLRKAVYDDFMFDHCAVLVS